MKQRGGSWPWIALILIASGVAWLAWIGLSDLYQHIDIRAPTSSAQSPREEANSQAAAELQAAKPELESAPAPAPSSADGSIEIKVSAAKKAQAGALVRLFSRGERDANTGRVVWRSAGKGTSDAEGLVTLPARAGRYLAVANLAGMAPSFLELRHPSGEPLTRAQLELEPGAALEGRTILRGNREPAPLAQLVCTPYLSDAAVNARTLADAPGEIQVRAESDARGNFHIADLTPGFWQVEASAPGSGKALARSVRVPRLAQGPLILELIASSYIEGYVLSADNRPASGVELVARGSAATENSLSAESGAFSIEVGPGAWALSARRDSEAGSVPHTIAVLEGETHRGVEIRLGAGAVIAGVVVHKKDGAPFAGARISLSPHGVDGDLGRAVSDAAGKFASIGLVSGSYDVVVDAEGAASAMERGITLAAGQRFETRFELGGSGAIEGVVRDAQGRPVENASIEVQPSGPGVFANHGSAAAKSGADGAYRLLEVASGRAQLNAVREGAKLGSQAEVNVREGETAHADFVLKQTGRIEGHVARANGPLPDLVRVTAAGAFHNAVSASVAADGSYALELPSGSYSLSADTGPGSQRSASADIGLEPEQTVTKDLLLPDSVEAGLIVHVLEPGGAPSPLALVMVGSQRNGHNGTSSGGTADMNGDFIVQRPRADLPDSILITANNGARTGETSVASGVTQATVQLLPAASLHGRLIDSSGNAPISSFVLELSPANPLVFMSSGSRLQFTGDSFDLADQAAGALALHATTSDGRSGDASATLEPGVAAELNIPIVAASGISGRAVDEEGAPIAGAGIWLENSSSIYCDENGAFQVQGVPPGAHQLNGFAQPGLTAKREIQLAQGQQLDVGDFVLQATKAPPGTIGVYLRGDSSGVSVTSVVPSSPADFAGVLSGDIIAAIDGIAVAGIADAQTRVRGAPGTPVTLTLDRAGRVLLIQIVRAS